MVIVWFGGYCGCFYRGYRDTSTERAEKITLDEAQLGARPHEFKTVERKRKKCMKKFTLEIKIEN